MAKNVSLLPTETRREVAILRLGAETYHGVLYSHYKVLHPLHEKLREEVLNFLSIP